MLPSCKLLLAVLLSAALVGTVCGQTPPVKPAVVDLEINGAANHLFGIGWIGARPDRSIAVVQFQNAVLRYFDPNGRSGDEVRIAPEANARLNAAGTFGDSIWINDASVPQLTLVSPTHKIARRLSTAVAIVLPSGDESPFAPPLGMVAPRPVGISPGGGFLLLAPRIPARASPSELHQPPNAYAALAQVASNGVLKRVVSWMQQNPGCNARSGTWTVSLPLCVQPQTAVSSDGRLVATVEAAVTGADSGTFQATVVNVRGDTVYSRRNRFAVRPVSQREADSAIARTTASFRRTSNYAVVNAIEAAFHPTLHPPFESLLLADDGSVWLELSGEGIAMPWLVLTAAGEVSRIVALPAGLRLRTISGSVLWATRRDGPNEESILRLHVE
ncbi:MAG: hypothetical protein ABIZ70_00550 [Gemmatimonadales bacterium]